MTSQAKSSKSGGSARESVQRRSKTTAKSQPSEKVTEAANTSVDGTIDISSMLKGPCVKKLSTRAKKGAAQEPSSPSKERDVSENKDLTPVAQPSAQESTPNVSTPEQSTIALEATSAQTASAPMKGVSESVWAAVEAEDEPMDGSRSSSTLKRAAPGNEEPVAKRPCVERPRVLTGMGALLGGHVKARPVRVPIPPAFQQSKPSVSEKQNKAIDEQLEKVEKARNEVEIMIAQARERRLVSLEAQPVLDCPPASAALSCRNWGLNMAYTRLRYSIKERAEFPAAVAAFLRVVVSLKQTNCLAEEAVIALTNFVEELSHANDSGDVEKFQKASNLLKNALTNLGVTSVDLISSQPSVLDDPKKRVCSIVDAIVQLVKYYIPGRSDEVKSLLTDLENFETIVAGIVVDKMSLRDEFRDILAKIYREVKTTSSFLDEDKRNDDNMLELCGRAVEGSVKSLRLSLSNVTPLISHDRLQQYQALYPALLDQLLAATKLQIRREFNHVTVRSTVQLSVGQARPQPG